MIDFDFKGAIVHDQGIIGASRLFTIDEKLIAIDGNPVKRFPHLFDLKGVTLIP